MAAHPVEYDIQTLPDTANTRPSYARLTEKWPPHLANAAKIASYLYLSVRAIFLVLFGRSWWMWAIFYVECTFAVEYHRIQSIPVSAKLYGDINLGQHRDRLRLLDNNAKERALPLVDILITCCGEPLEIILDTVRGACKVAYPVDRFRVLVLDDGKSSELQHEIQQLQKTWNQLHYHCRKSSMTQQNIFSKAENLNYAIFNIQEPMKQPPEFVAIFDADFIPSPDFLRATLPHLLRSPKLAIAGACQDFYNIPKDDPLAQSLDNWQRKLVPHLNQLGSCFHAHSGSVIRRSTLMQCQGFPTVSCNEDVLLSFILLGSGYHIISLPEMLQLGRCPESLQGHISQRTRWAIGLTQMMLTMKPTSNNTVPPKFRKGIFNFGLTVVFSLMNRTLVQVILPLTLWSGQKFIPGPSPLYCKIQAFLAIVYLGLIWSFELSLTAKTSSGGPPFGDMEEIWLAPKSLVVMFRHFFWPQRSGGSSVTGSTLNPWNKSKTITLPARLKRDFWDGGVFINALSFVTTCGALLNAVLSSEKNYEKILYGLAWPPVLHLSYLVITSNWTPLACTLAPPAWTNPMTLAMEPGNMDSEVMFSRPELQRSLRPRRQLLGYANHQALAPLVLIGASLAVFII